MYGGNRFEIIVLVVIGNAHLNRWVVTLSKCVTTIGFHHLEQNTNIAHFHDLK